MKRLGRVLVNVGWVLIFGFPVFYSALCVIGSIQVSPWLYFLSALSAALLVWGWKAEEAKSKMLSEMWWRERKARDERERQ